MLDCISRETAAVERINSAAKGADAIILISEYDTALEEFSSSVPTVGVCVHDSFGGKISVVDMDPYQTAELATAYFKEKGVRCVVAVSKKGAPPSYLNRIETFAAAWRDEGGEVELLDISKQMLFNPELGYFFATSSMLQECSRKNFDKTGKLFTECMTD